MLTSRNRLSIKKIYNTYRCRRTTERKTISPASITCWASQRQASNVSAIEIDTRGARLILPWETTRGEHIRVSVKNELGQYQTTRARVAWTQELPRTAKVVAGLAFDEEINLYDEIAA